MSYSQIIGIPMVQNCAPLPADLFFYSYDGKFLANIIRSGQGELLGHSICVTYIMMKEYLMFKIIHESLNIILIDS